VVRFVDTNILLYSVSTHQQEARKAAAARELLDADDLCLSVQVLQEFYVQATRSSRPWALTHDEAALFMETWLRFPVQETTIELVRKACATSARWRLSYWDAAVIEAARMQGCEQALSEDLNAGQDYGGVRVVNPFA
jgi:predicted nucleic acid-binding protein